MMTQDKPQFFGEDGKLFGVLSEGESSKPLLLMTNTGFHECVGPYQIYLDFARLLQAHGYSSFRFDLPGRGLSAPMAQQDKEAGDLAAAKKAMDHLVKAGKAEKFIFFGICSAGQLAQKLAVVDDRVVGIAQMDPFVVESPFSALYNYAYLLRSPLVVLRKILLRWRRRQESESLNSGRSYKYGIPQPSTEQIYNEIQALLTKKTKIFVTYSADMCKWFSYARQYHDTFKVAKDNRNVRVELNRAYDHILSIPRLRFDYFNKLLGWLKEPL